MVQALSKASGSSLGYGFPQDLDANGVPAGKIAEAVIRTVEVVP